jgi:hypothetical protein
VPTCFRHPLLFHSRTGICSSAQSMTCQGSIQKAWLLLGFIDQACHLLPASSTYAQSIRETVLEVNIECYDIRHSGPVSSVAPLPYSPTQASCPLPLRGEACCCQLPHDTAASAALESKSSSLQDTRSACRYKAAAQCLPGCAWHAPGRPHRLPGSAVATSSECPSDVQPKRAPRHVQR